ncbi:hypothetical protein C8R46DRAFT_1065897 [Mycena filopes]|nr:hypothetical protein C8R46DRAFT_1065897 [Mycena filopes]
MAESSSTGLLSGVFSFVSRELESFIITATGGSVPEIHASIPQEPLPYTSTRRRDEPKGNPGGPVRTLRRTPASPRDRQRATAERHRNRRSPSASASPEQPNPAHKTNRRVIVVEEDGYPSEYSQSPSPSPPPLPRALRRRASITMPGSLYPRSASAEPESPPRHSDAEPRQVRFAPDIVSPPARSRHEADSSARSFPAPFRPAAIPSVKAAVERFQTGADDADPSILLPSPKGKARAVVPPEDDSPRLTSREKGKGRARDFEEADTSGQVRVKGKERELSAAREEQKRNEERRWERDKMKDKQDEAERDREREKDKERIRMLEGEIQRLKNEVRRITPIKLS